MEPLVPRARLSGVLVSLFAVDRDAFARAGLELMDVLERLGARAGVVDEELKVLGWFALLPDDHAAMAARLQPGHALMALRRPPPTDVPPTRFFSLLFEVADADRIRLIAFCDALNLEAGRMSKAPAVWLELAALLPEAQRTELLEAFERHSAPIPRPSAARAARDAGLLAERTVFVDASNLAWRAIERAVSPAAALDATARALVQAGADEARLDVIFDASFFGNKRGAARRLPRREWSLLERGEAEGRWRRTPASTKADAQILGRLRADPRAVVVSNDLFHKERDLGLTPPDLFDRHIKVDLGRRDLRLAFPRSWPDAPNVVVSYRE